MDPRLRNRAGLNSHGDFWWVTGVGSPGMCFRGYDLSRGSGEHGGGCFPGAGSGV